MEESIFKTLTRAFGIMKKALLVGLLLLSMGVVAQLTERLAMNLDLKTNPIGFLAGNYSILMETPMKNPCWTISWVHGCGQIRIL